MFKLVVSADQSIRVIYSKYGGNREDVLYSKKVVYDVDTDKLGNDNGTSPLFADNFENFTAGEGLEKLCRLRHGVQKYTL